MSFLPLYLLSSHARYQVALSLAALGESMRAIHITLTLQFSIQHLELVRQMRSDTVGGTYAMLYLTPRNFCPTIHR